MCCAIPYHCWVVFFNALEQLVSLWLLECRDDIILECYDDAVPMRLLFVMCHRWGIVDACTQLPVPKIAVPIALVSITSGCNAILHALLATLPKAPYFVQRLGV